MTRPSYYTLAPAAALTVFAFTFTACGGGSHGGGIGGTGIVFGAISGLGSVIVDDIDFDTADAVITKNGDPASVADLALGAIVTIEGEFDEIDMTGTADSISISTLLEGPLQRLADDASTATVVGGAVVLGRDTLVDGIVLEPAAIGEYVEVSGFVDAAGNIRATRIVGVPAPVDLGLALRGNVEGADVGTNTFMIRGVNVNYAGAELIDAPASGIVDGLDVRITVLAPPSNGSVQAVRVRFFAPSSAEQVDRIVKHEGIVTRQLAPRRFVLGGRRIFSVTASTRIVGGRLVDIRPDVAVALVGVLDSEGIVRAERLEIRGAVDAVPTAPLGTADQRAYFDSF